MTPQEIFTKHLQITIGKLAMELATANAVLEINQEQEKDRQKSVAEAPAPTEDRSVDPE